MRLHCIHNFQNESTCEQHYQDLKILTTSLRPRVSYDEFEIELRNTKTAKTGPFVLYNKQNSTLNEFDHRILALLSSSEKGLNGVLNPDLCDAVLHQLSCQADWEEVVVWVDYKPLDVEIDDDNAGILPCT